VSDIDTGVADSLKVLDPDGRLEKRTLMIQIVVTNCDFMSTRPSTTLADFERHGIPESVFQ
jgi:hypothetical protein